MALFWKIFLVCYHFMYPHIVIIITKYVPVYHTALSIIIKHHGNVLRILEELKIHVYLM